MFRKGLVYIDKENGIWILVKFIFACGKSFSWKYVSHSEIIVLPNLATRLMICLDAI